MSINVYEKGKLTYRNACKIFREGPLFPCGPSGAFNFNTNTRTMLHRNSKFSNIDTQTGATSTFVYRVSFIQHLWNRKKKKVHLGRKLKKFALLVKHWENIYLNFFVYVFVCGVTFGRFMFSTRTSHNFISIFFHTSSVEGVGFVNVSSVPSQTSK